MHNYCIGKGNWKATLFDWFTIISVLGRVFIGYLEVHMFTQSPDSVIWVSQSYKNAYYITINAHRSVIFLVVVFGVTPNCTHQISSGYL